MGSELEIGRGGPTGVRFELPRGAGVCWRGVRGGGVAKEGASVSASVFVRAASAESRVVAVSNSTGAPQDEQNRPLDESLVPHEEQYIGGRDFITGSIFAAMNNQLSAATKIMTVPLST